MHASISSFDSKLGVKMKQFDGSMALGCEKVHVF